MAALYIATFFTASLYLVKPFLDPYSIICRVVCYTFFSPEADAAIACLAYVPLGLVLIAALASRGRGWCNWICPWGTILDALTRLLSKGDKVGKRCDRCRRCFK